MIASGLLALCAGSAAQIAGLEGEYRKTDIEVTVENGTTMYALVREFYPRRMNRWLAVAADIAAVNPQAFRNGDPANMIVGRNLYLIDYGDGIAGEPAVTRQSASAGPDPTDAPPPAPTVAPDTSDGRVPAGDARAATALSTDPRDVAAATPASPDGGVAAAAPPPAAMPPRSPPRIGQIAALEGTPVVVDTSGAQRALTSGDMLRLGDMLIAGDEGRIGLVMSDKAMIDVEPGGRVLFERYAFSETSPGSVGVMTLLDGGVRIQTGLIGTRGGGAVSVNTPVATVTVHGTRFALRLCTAERCRISGRDRALSDGLYAGVTEGAINVANNTGDTTLTRGDVVRVRGADANVEAAPEARTLIFTDAELAALRIEIDRPMGFWEWFRQRFFGTG